MYEEVKNDLRALMKRANKSQKQVSKETGISSAAISQFLNGTYTGKNDEMARRLNQYITLEESRLNVVKTDVIYEKLHNTENALFACTVANKRNIMALVCGEAGAGKTTALNLYKDRNASAVLVTANSCAKTATAALGLICKELHLETPKNKTAMISAIVARLKGTNRLIIIDEADHLTLDALQAVRNINDMAGVGIVLSGNNKIYQQMKSPRNGGSFDQIRTRIAVRKYMDNIFTIEEMSNIFPNLDEACIGTMIKIAEAESLRTAKQLYGIAEEFSAIKNEPLTVQKLQSVQRQMIGDVI